ncbi:MAG TPA: lysophospholipid acyltransferase family protein [Gemmatimonadaceae bacterium]|nr:lysophospholipid acyltransferase family protein [Gemmatimonadaceae bacterium]
MRTVLTMVVVTLATCTLGPLVLVAGLLGVQEKPGGVYQWAMHTWARAACRAAGVRIEVHDQAGMATREGAVYIANHVSWFDVLALAATLPRYSFVAKSELRRIPVFGPAAAAAGIVFLERENRKRAFESYKEAAAHVRGGRSVVVYPEGTRGQYYPLRPFKKGPFVLAIAAGAEVVPTVIYGAREVMKRGSFRVRPGVIHLHFLEPIPTAGLDYDDRGPLMTRVWTRMDDTLHELYGVRRADRAIAKPNERVV